MPELPEVETTRRGISPLLLGRRVLSLRVRQPQLRWPVPPDLAARLCAHPILDVHRRAKYLLIDVGAGCALLHLGMSGSLRLLAADTPPGAHDHVDLVLDSGLALRLTDPRRFGALLWAPAPALQHPLLAHLGPEPLGPTFSGAHLARAAAGRRQAVKALIMDQRVVVGVGNIYACEALHAAGIDPRRAAGRISQERYARLAGAIRDTLLAAIDAGGTTLRDFVSSDGRPGYFRQQLRVYGREGLPCPGCGTPLVRQVLAQRSTYFCRHCQR